MEKIEFYGSSLLIPMFLVSVGTVIDPRVLLNWGTIGVALVFSVVCIGGKLCASLTTKPLFGYSLGRSRDHVLAVGRGGGGNSRDVHRAADRAPGHERGERDHARDHPESARLVDHRGRRRYGLRIPPPPTDACAASGGPCSSTSTSRARCRRRCTDLEADGWRCSRHRSNECVAYSAVRHRQARMERRAMRDLQRSTSRAS